MKKLKVESLIGNWKDLKIPSFDRFQNHPANLVGWIFRIGEPETVRMGDCFFDGRLKKGDLVLCVRHSGDYFQDYIFLQEYENALEGLPDFNFGSYGIGKSERIFECTPDQFYKLCAGGSVDFE